MHDINHIYSQYLVDRLLEERREQVEAWRRATSATTRTPAIARLKALLRMLRERPMVTLETRKAVS